MLVYSSRLRFGTHQPFHHCFRRIHGYQSQPRNRMYKFIGGACLLTGSSQTYTIPSELAYLWPQHGLQLITLPWAVPNLQKWSFSAPAANSSLLRVSVNVQTDVLSCSLGFWINEDLYSACSGTIPTSARLKWHFWYEHNRRQSVPWAESSALKGPRSRCTRHEARNAA